MIIICIKNIYKHGYMMKNLNYKICLDNII